MAHTLETLKLYCETIEQNPKTIFMLESVELFQQALAYAVSKNMLTSVKVILDNLNVPDTLTLKQRLSYYYLLKD